MFLSRLCEIILFCHFTAGKAGLRGCGQRQLLFVILSHFCQGILKTNSSVVVLVYQDA